MFVIPSVLSAVGVIPNMLNKVSPLAFNHSASYPRTQYCSIVRKFLNYKDHVRGRKFYRYFEIFWLYTLISAHITFQQILGEMIHTLVSHQLRA